MSIVKKLMLAAVVLPLTFGAISVNAKHHGGGHGECGGFDRELFKQLDLSDEQKAQLKELKKSNHAEMKEKFKANKSQIKAAIKSHREEMKDLMSAPNFDEARARKLVTAKMEKQIDMQVKKLAVKHQMMSVLTEEQKAKAIELNQEKRANCMKKMKKRMKEG